MEKSHNSLINQSGCVKLDEKKTFNNTGKLAFI